MSRSRCRVLLLSAAPEAYSSMLDVLHARGITAKAACSPQDASRLIHHHPTTVLVDLVHGAGVDEATIETINRLRGRALVLALHAGGLGEFYEKISDLNVDGFCRYDDWKAIAEATPSDDMSFALH